MDEENIEQNEQKEIGDVLFDLKRKFDNFWYHHKAKVIISAIFLTFIIICIVQCATKTKGDVNIAYIGAAEINPAQYDSLQTALIEIFGRDLDGDGKIQVEFTRFLYMTSVQAEDARAKGNAVDMQSLMTVQTRINLEFAEGNNIIYFIDPEVYRELSNRGWEFMLLDDSLGYEPDDAYDFCALKLGSLPCWDYYYGLNGFPENTIVTVREMQPSEQNDEKMKESYERNLLMFRRLAEFTFESDETDETED